MLNQWILSLRTNYASLKEHQNLFVEIFVCFILKYTKYCYMHICQATSSRKDKLFVNNPLLGHATIEEAVFNMSSAPSNNGITVLRNLFLRNESGLRRVLRREVNPDAITWVHRVEEGSNTSTVTLRVVGGDENGSLKWGSTPSLTDWLTLSRNVTLTWYNNM
jgi:hypothetical protein